jgi:hypothetical protein
MVHPTIVAPGIVQSWRRRTIKEHQTMLTWDSLSNYWDVSQNIPGASERKVPETVVHKVKDDLDAGQYSVTVLSPRMVAMAAIGGGNTALGQEGNASSRMISVYYNIQRFPVVVGDRSVTGRMADKFYNLADRASTVISDLFAKQTENDHWKALLEGGDSFLTSASYWQNADRPSSINAPLSPVFHPNVYYQINGAATKNTYSETWATAIGNLENATDTEWDNDDTFSLTSLDIMHLIAMRSINPLPGVKGDARVKWVAIISDAQWYQLCVDTTANASIRDLIKYTDKDMATIMKGIPGAEGVYKNMLLVVSQTSPLFNNTSGTGTFQYFAPLSDGRTRVAWVDNAGTAEIACVLGNSALMMADVSSVDYEKENLDYNFSKNMCGIRERGTQRTDLDSTVAATSARVNQSSFLYLTVTNTASMVS